MTSPLLLTALGTAETARLGGYLKTSFVSASTKGSATTIPQGMDIDDVAACDWSAALLVEATKNIRTTSWSIKDYRDYLMRLSPCSTGRNETLERKLLLKFPPISPVTEVITKPCMIVDKDGYIIVCYLPRLIKREHRLPMWRSIAKMEKYMDLRKGSSSWRNDAANYMSPAQCQTRPGTFSLAPFWYQQAHSTVAQLEVSAKMRTSEGLSWVRDIKAISSLLGALLSVVHPAQYRAGMHCIDVVAANPHLVDKADDLGSVLQSWSAPFTGVSVMNNRQTPVHRDNGGFCETMDLLASVGPYLRASMGLPTLNIVLDYPTGTGVFILSKLTAHQVEAEGERAVFSYYLKEAVVAALTNEFIDFVNVKDLV